MKSHAAATFRAHDSSDRHDYGGDLHLLASHRDLFRDLSLGRLWWQCGVLLGLAFLRVPAPYPKLLFSAVVFTFAIALWLTRRNETDPSKRGVRSLDRKTFLIVGAIGGVLASQTGSGADMLIFMVMMMAYRLDGKQAVPTSVCIMAVVSVAGSLGLLLMPHREIGVVWHYWAVCVPVVAIGAPLGAYVISTVPPRVIMIAVLTLVGVKSCRHCSWSR